MSRRPPKAKPKLAKPMTKADQAFSKYIRARDKVCQAQTFTDVTCKGSLQCCHIFGRGEHALRVDEDNSIAMCAGHHMFFTHHPAQWMDFIEGQYPGRREELLGRVRRHRASGAKLDWPFLARYWTERLRQQEADV